MSHRIAGSSGRKGVPNWPKVTSSVFTKNRICNAWHPIILVPNVVLRMSDGQLARWHVFSTLHASRTCRFFHFILWILDLRICGRLFEPSALHFRETIHLRTNTPILVFSVRIETSNLLPRLFLSPTDQKKHKMCLNHLQTSKIGHLHRGVGTL